ncbi:MAG: response regulator [Deltaproteobacteria bacterium]|nr:response regulator [Deltaproteobacteria bacterium]
MRDPIKIVVIDDEPIVGERLKAMLVRDGHRVENFVNPLKAIDRLQETDFDIVITDIRMGEMDGIQVLEKVFEKSRHTRVIMISGYATLDLAKESLTKGAFDFIAKPFKLKELRNTIKKAVKSLDRANEQSASAASA